MRIFTLWFLLLGFSFMQARILEGPAASAIIPQADLVRYSERSSLPNYIRFTSPQDLPQGDIQAFVLDLLTPGPAVSLELIDVSYDHLGFMHLRFLQSYQDIPVWGSMLIVHYQLGKGIHSINGDIYAIDGLNILSQLNEKTALDLAKQHIGAEVYKWEVEEEELFAQKLATKGIGTGSFYPQSKTVILPVKNGQEANEYKLAYEWDLYAHQPHGRYNVYVDAATGEILQKIDRIHTADATGTAETKYSGTRTIVADDNGGSYRLREAGRGNGVETYNLLNGTSYGAAVDFTDADNYWNNFNAQLDEVATDAHWGAEMTYDYFLLEHGRNSIDGNGFPLISYVHYSNNYVNAFWNGSYMTYGDGDASVDPLTALDVCGHEIAHGLTTFTANLVYSYESGALNESFSDIFGATVEEYARPANHNWLIGEDMNFTIRNMQNPNAYGDPDTYLGTNWYSGAGDNGGVHTNSGVQNFWFYLLTDGGSGTNDLSDAYSVTGLGYEDASAIAFRNLTVYLTTNSQYSDARFYAIQAASDLFGACSNEMIQTTNAWYAVGVGAAYTPPTVVSDFSASTTQLCSSPATVSFTNASAFASSYVWDFGDANSSTATNPSHSYAGPGSYTVTLTVSGGCGGAVETKSNFIVVSPPPASPTASGASGPCKTALNLTASGSGDIQWLDSAFNVLGSGTSFTTPILNQPVSYFAQNVQFTGPFYVPPVDPTFGGGGLSQQYIHPVSGVFCRKRYDPGIGLGRCRWSGRPQYPIMGWQWKPVGRIYPYHTCRSKPGNFGHSPESRQLSHWGHPNEFVSKQFWPCLSI